MTFSVFVEMAMNSATGGSRAARGVPERGDRVGQEQAPHQAQLPFLQQTKQECRERKEKEREEKILVYEKVH